LTLLLLAGWIVLSPAWFWTLSVVGIIMIPPLVASILDLFQKADDTTWTQHLVSTVRSAGRRLFQAAFSLICLPYEAFFSMDAIARTIVRLITRRRLLEWNPSSED
jgi:hypothetical protein